MQLCCQGSDLRCYFLCIRSLSHAWRPISSSTEPTDCQAIDAITPELTRGCHLPDVVQAFKTQQGLLVPAADQLLLPGAHMAVACLAWSTHLLAGRFTVRRRIRDLLLMGSHLCIAACLPAGRASVKACTQPSQWLQRKLRSTRQDTVLQLAVSRSAAIVVHSLPPVETETGL